MSWSLGPFLYNHAMEKKSDFEISSGYVYVNTAEKLADLTETLRGAARVGVDTEADSLHHYFEKVCLIQLSFSGANYIVDPLAGFSLAEFLEVLSQKELILQGADYDLRMLKKTFGFRPKAPVFDTMLAAQVLGYEKIGLASLVERFFRILLSKAGQKSDWSLRPLPARLLHYASDDTKYLEAIADGLSENLQRLNRVGWHRECCERVVTSTGLPEKNEAKEVWRIKGSSKMAPNVLVFVRELWKWRDGEARQKDRPPFMIMRNEDLIELAEWRAKNLQVPLSQGPVFLKKFTGENFVRLENAIRFAEGLPLEEWPLLQKRAEWTEVQVDQTKLELLLVACKMLATELQIEPSFLASRSALTAVIQHQPPSIEKGKEWSAMKHWQAELINPAINRLFG